MIRGNILLNTTSNRSLVANAQGIGAFDGWYDDWVVENNVVATGHYHGISLLGARNCRVVNNTVVVNPFYTGAAEPWITITYHKDGSLGTGNVMNNNLYSRLPDTSFPVVGTSQNNNLVSTSYTSHFVDYAGLDFHLKSTSSAVGYGTTSNAPTIDLDGVTRSVPYDAGAYEFVGTPAAPTGLALTVAAYNQINLTWTDNASNETGFKVERKKGASGTYAQIGTAGVNATSYSDSTCGSGTNYYYRVRAYNASGDSAYSAEQNATTTEITSGRQGHWKLDASSGTSATDSSGNGNTGTTSGGPTWVAGKIGNGLNFDGVDDSVNCGSGATLDNLAAITVTAWIKADTMGEGGKGRIVVKASGINPTAGWHLHVSGTNQLEFRVDYTTTELSRVAAVDAIATGVWKHVVATWTGSATATNLKLYVDGAEVGYASTTNGVGTRVDDAASNFYIGNESGGTRTFDGLLDDVRVYNRVLSAAEITAVYRAGL